MIRIKDSCAAVVFSNEQLANRLPSATAIVFTAYSAVNCPSDKLIATADSITTKPGKVAGVTLTELSTKLKVSWTAQTGTVTGYKVQWKSGNQDYNTGNRQKTVTGASTISTSITGLTNDTAYTVKVTAYNTTGDGPASNEATATPAAVTLAASNISASGATLTISNHIDAWWYKGNQSGATCTSGRRRHRRCDAVEPRRRHLLHLQGLQRQHLRHGTGDRRRLPHQARKDDRSDDDKLQPPSSRSPGRP